MRIFVSRSVFCFFSSSVFKVFAPVRSVLSDFGDGVDFESVFLEVVDDCGQPCHPESLERFDARDASVLPDIGNDFLLLGLLVHIIFP